MTKEKALEAWKKMRSEIDSDNWLFVGTINPEMVDFAIEALSAEAPKPTSVENQHRKEHESWLEQYSRANEAEEKVKELETKVCELYKKLADAEPQESEGDDEN